MLTYTDLILLETFEERLDYLYIGNVAPAEHTFGVLRELSQQFYKSPAWKRVRQHVIARDLGYDLAVPGRDIFGRVIVHHMNPLVPKDIYHNSEITLDPEFLITVSHETHLGIHFGYQPEETFLLERVEGDTKLW